MHVYDDKVPFGSGRLPLLLVNSLALPVVSHTFPTARHTALAVLFPSLLHELNVFSSAHFHSLLLEPDSIRAGSHLLIKRW